jgi:hypothetical protein
MKPYLFFVLVEALILTACGGGTLGGGSLAVAISPARLTFGTEVVGTTSQPLPLTVTNVGSGTLSIASVTASADFGETNTCSQSLAAGTKCIITVRFSPRTSGNANGDASGSPNEKQVPH